jgi:hypothetical protein
MMGFADPIADGVIARTEGHDARASNGRKE